MLMSVQDFVCYTVKIEFSFMFIQVKCQKYWPVTEAELFGSLTVNPIEEWELTDYTIRKFQLQQVRYYVLNYPNSKILIPYQQ